MATTLFSSWMQGNLGLFPTPAEDDDPLPQVGVTLFVRAPHLEDDSTTTGWATVSTLDDLLTSPHWQPPSRFSGGELVFDAVAALAPFFVTPSGGRNIVQLAEPFTIVDAGSHSAPPVVAMAIWFNGTLGGKYRPIINMVRFDSPILIMADPDHPTTLASMLLFAWRP